MNKRKRKAVIDDGMNPELISGIQKDELMGIFEIPLVRSPIQLSDVHDIVPFSMRDRDVIVPKNAILCNHENDPIFSDILIHPGLYIDDFKRFNLVEPPDCSLYWNAPLSAQITNTYRRNALGYYYQHRGVNILPLVRWGDDRTYTTRVFPEKIAFLGYERHSIVAIGSYGVVKTIEEKYHFKNGLREMIKELEPSIVVVYGAMPDDVFGEFISSTRFISFPDWTTRMKGGDQ